MKSSGGGEWSLFRFQVILDKNLYRFYSACRQTILFTSQGWDGHDYEPDYTSKRQTSVCEYHDRTFGGIVLLHTKTALSMQYLAVHVLINFWENPIRGAWIINDSVCLFVCLVVCLFVCLVVGVILEWPRVQSNVPRLTQGCQYRFIIYPWNRLVEANEVYSGSR